jgi:hypothetical protein
MRGRRASRIGGALFLSGGAGVALAQKIGRFEKEQSKLLTLDRNGLERQFTLPITKA